MICVVTFEDGSEEAFQVADRTRIGSLRKTGYWVIPTSEGGTVALAESDVVRVELGQIAFADDAGRVDADSGMGEP